MFSQGVAVERRGILLPVLGFQWSSSLTLKPWMKQRSKVLGIFESVRDSASQIFLLLVYTMLCLGVLLVVYRFH